MSAVTILCRDGAALEAALAQFRALLAADTAVWRASIADAGGPIHVSPAATTDRANAAFSERNP